MDESWWHRLDHSRYREKGFNSAWLRPYQLSERLDKNDPEIFNRAVLSYSPNGRPIEFLSWGKGKLKLLFWAQMHGNESTGAKALLDLFAYLEQNKNTEQVKLWQKSFSIGFIPQLNPDGAELFRRQNSQGIDLNRDARVRQTLEIKALWHKIEEWKTDWCFNLHDQRNIFSVGNPPQAATLSLLAPAAGEDRSLNTDRKICMRLAGSVVKDLQDFIPNHIGAFSDEFYPRALGDNLMASGFKNLLLEAGPFPNDPQRNKAREAFFRAYLSIFNTLAKDARLEKADAAPYHDLPVNQQFYRDLIIRQVKLSRPNGFTMADVALLKRFEANFEKQQLEQSWILAEVGDLAHLRAFEEWEGGSLSWKEAPKLDFPASFSYHNENRKASFDNGLLSEH
jgi:hypothetical protein